MLSNAARSVLQRMKAADDRDELDDAEIVCEGNVCYVGLDRIARRTVSELLRLVLVSSGGEIGSSFERYKLNQEGRAMVADPNYRPLILDALRRDSGLDR